ELRTYPEDLLASPLDVRSFEVATEPGENTAAGASAVAPSSSDPFGSAMAALDRRLQTMIGDGRLTPLVGALAVGLAVLLGCGHALLPGHGKTVMAAYLAGRRGHSRDAVLVGATVTATHTVGVLVLGLAVSLSSSFAGDQVLRWLGVVSGALVASIGALMLRGAVRTRRSDDAAVVEDAPLAVGVGALVSAGVGTRPHVRATDVRTRDHSHGHDHSHDHDHPHDHDHLHADNHDHVDGGVRAWWSGRHSHHPGGHTHAPHAHGHRSGRGGLVGMGIAGGLVPSPSALVVLLASIGLGRTVFGVFLVVAYGLGMATTLTAVGLALVHMRDRLSRRLTVTGSSNPLRRIARTAPLLTAALVLTVGLALVVRGAVLGA
ncbi:nickel/cobalt transporter, partial [Geodermatophilus chilensis]|uniref:nickel/cobalt transporter n=1 Tax=Geodermatophilus chilensis TaxID=2035835 RepID=UPI001E34888F